MASAPSLDVGRTNGRPAAPPTRGTNRERTMSATYELRPATKTAPAVLVVTLPVNPEPPLSSTGKTRIVASTHGNQPTTLTVNGQTVKVGLTAFVKA